MGKIVYGLGLVLVCTGCLHYQPRQFPLQPGEVIVFQDAGRADAFRTTSGNDAFCRGTNVVTITRPTLVQCE